jgi:hypothetical protein
MGADILDATTGQSLFTYPVVNFLSIGISLDVAFVAFLKHGGTVEIWNAPTQHYHKSIAIDTDVLHIALSPNGSQLASLSPSHMKLWDLKSEGCLAHLEFHWKLQGQAQISFATNATSVSVLEDIYGTRSWCISHNHNIDLTRSNTQWWQDHTKLPMVFVPTMEEWSNQDASTPCYSYRCDTDGEWILDQDWGQVLWIPPDERPREFLCFKHKKKVLVHTESGKVYLVNFS